MRALWEVRLKKEGFKATKYLKVCSKLFKPKCFDTRKFGGTWLKKDALPSIFNFPNHLQKEENKRKPPNKRCVVDQTTNKNPDTSDKAVKGTKRKCFLGDFTEEDVASPTKARKVRGVTNHVVKAYRKKNQEFSKKEQEIKKKYFIFEGGFG